MRTLNTRALSRGVSALALFLGLGFHPAGDAAGIGNGGSECEDPNAPQITEAETLQGRGAIQLDEQGTLLVALDTDRNPGADVLFRIAPYQEVTALQAAVDINAGSRPLLLIERKGVGYHELEVSGLKGDVEAMLFVLDQRECLSRDKASETVASTVSVPVRAIGKKRFGNSEQSPSQLLSDHEFAPLILRESDFRSGSEMQQQSEPLWCMAGGEGASACSLSFGSLGPIGSGECSVSCNDSPASYACCGPGFGNYCVCIESDTTPGGGPGEGDSGDGGDSGGGGGDGGAGGGGSNGGDSGAGGDDEDEDEGTGDEESNCVDCPSVPT